MHSDRLVPGGYSNHAMSLDAEAFIAARGLQRPIVMAHSMGVIPAKAGTQVATFLLPPRCLAWVVTTDFSGPWMFLSSAERRFSVPA